VGLALQVLPVFRPGPSKRRQASSELSMIPLQQPVIEYQFGAASEPALAVTRAGQNLVSVGLRGFDL